MSYWKEVPKPHQPHVPIEEVIDPRSLEPDPEKRLLLKERLEKEGNAMSPEEKEYIMELLGMPPSGEAAADSGGEWKDYDPEEERARKEILFHEYGGNEDDNPKGESEASQVSKDAPEVHETGFKEPNPRLAVNKIREARGAKIDKNLWKGVKGIRQKRTGRTPRSKQPWKQTGKGETIRKSGEHYEALWADR